MRELIEKLAHVDPPNEPGFERALGVRPEFVDEHEVFVRYRAVLRDGPFHDVEIRVHKDEAKGLVSLTPAEGVEVREDAIDFAPFGELKDVAMNPRIPPEGTVTRVYRMGAAELRFQFTSQGRVLRSVSLIWDRKEAA